MTQWQIKIFRKSSLAWSQNRTLYETNTDEIAVIPRVGEWIEWQPANQAHSDCFQQIEKIEHSIATKTVFIITD